MQEGYQENNTPTVDPNEPTIIKTDVGAKDGQDKCPQCGATDITLNPANGHLVCNFCRHEFEMQKAPEMAPDLSQLQGQVMGSGAADIAADTNDIVTFKCSSCGAEVVIDTTSSTQARCHWCRNMLSLNQQMPNGSIPDVVLPFAMNKDAAQKEIQKFVGKRKFFAHPKFKQEFHTNNIMGVYFPYMLVGVNAHACLIGEGEQLKKEYFRGREEEGQQIYDADLFHIEREFDIVIDGLSVESNSDRLNAGAKNKTNNVINAVMPFDIENCVQYNANYLRGYTSERRDTNVQELKTIVDTQSKDIARIAMNETLEKYDRGVAWASEQLDVKGQQWQAAYLPVWLYSYQQVKGGKKILHYVAVNARTGKTMGSIPIHMPKLLGVTFALELLGFIAMLLIQFDYNFIFLLVGLIYFIMMYLGYRNSHARYTYETETKKQISNLRSVDQFVQTKFGLSNPTMVGANNRKVQGRQTGNKLLDAASLQNLENGAAAVSMLKNRIDHPGDINISFRKK